MGPAAPAGPFREPTHPSDPNCLAASPPTRQCDLRNTRLNSEPRGYGDKLSDGATITEPLKTAPWGDAFGICTDKFGVTWMVNIAAAQA